MAVNVLDGELTRTSIGNDTGSSRVVGALLVLIALLLSLGISSGLRAQVVGATLSGTIADPSGAVIPAASVTIRNTATGIVRVNTTNGAGLYSLPNVAPGDYEVTASASGFTSESATLTLTVGAQQTLNLTLNVGTSTQTVEITAVSPAINLVESTLGGLNDETTVRELPLNGRSWTDLATLQPGVSALRSQAAVTSSDRFTRGFGDQISISGARAEQNNYRLNGISINDPTNGGPGSVLGGNMGVDAISEFSVLTTNYSTEYGRASGGVINAITKSGTNAFHGDVYEFLRNAALDARNYFDLAQIPPFRRNQFGASAGGPIQKDKTFIFGDYEGLRQFLSISQTDTVPTAAARAGNLASGQVAVDPQATRYLNAFWPQPNGQIFGDTGFFSFPNPQPLTENYFTIRVDHRLSEKDSLTGAYYFDNSNVTTDDEFKNKSETTLIHRQYATLEENHIFSRTTVNDFRVGYNRYADGAPANVTAVNPAVADTSLGFLPGETAGQINISGLTGFSGGLNGAGLQKHFWENYQLYDDILVIKGVHSIKFGGSIERDALNLFYTGGAGNMYHFGTLSDFLTNKPLSLQVAAPNPTDTAQVRQSIFGLYIQDDVRLRPNLSVNLGLRWEMATVPNEAKGKVANLVNLTDVTPTLGNPLFQNNTTHNFEPRVGFAWDPFRTGKTSVRGGFGFYDQLWLAGYFSNSFALLYPFEQKGTASNLPTGSFPTGAAQAVVSSIATNPTLKHVEHLNPNPGRAYVMQWNFSVEREVVPNLTALIGYVGNHGLHGSTVDDDSDIVPPISSPAGYLWPCVAPGLPFVPAGTTPPPGLNPGCNGIGSGQRFNPNVGQIRTVLFGNSSLYDGLQLQVVKRMSHGFQVQGSFVWSKSLDMASGTLAGDQVTNGVTSGLFFVNPKLTRGVSDFNTPRVITLNYVWDIPTRQSFTGIKKATTGGWELGGIFTASDGVPFTPLLVGDPVGLNSADPIDYPDRLRGPGCSSLSNPGNVTNYIRLQCFSVPAAVVVNGIPYLRYGNAGRNIIRGPGLENFDFSAVKNTYVPRISESFNVQFRAEFFNIFNRSNFLPPVDNSFILDPSIAGFGVVPADPTTAIVSGAGAIDKTATTSRQVQFALKIIW